jgi:hypothetical protein
MNKLFTLFLLFCGLGIASAQSLTIDPSDSVYITANDSSQFSTINGLIFLHNNLSNPTDSIIVRWHLLSDTVPTGWTILFCDNQNCYQLPTSPKTSLPIAPGDSIDMHAEFSPACIGGIGTMRISATVEQSSNDSILQSFVFTYQANIANDCGTGINNITNNPAIHVFPNPATDQLSISGLTYGHNLTVQLIDLQGRVISSQNMVADNLVSLNVSSLTTGLYLVKISDQQNNQTTVNRFSKF